VDAVLLSKRFELKVTVDTGVKESPKRPDVVILSDKKHVKQTSNTKMKGDQELLGKKQQTEQPQRQVEMHAATGPDT